MDSFKLLIEGMMAKNDLEKAILKMKLSHK
jgi:hypothetical protein